MISKNLIRTTIEQSEKEILDFRDLINDQANLSIFFMKLWQIKDLYPKFTQYNPFTQKTLLLQELKNLAGIYCWYNITRDLFYIGSSNNLRQRMTCYLSLAYLTSHQDYSIINRALLKYGFSSFVLLILETLEQGKKEQLLELEQLVLDTFIPEYNIQPNASSSAGRILSEEHKAKIAASRKKIIISEETIVKMSVSHMGERNGRFNKGMPV